MIENHMVLPYADDDQEEDDMGVQIDLGHMTAEQIKQLAAEVLDELTDNDFEDLIREWAEGDETRIDNLADLADELAVERVDAK